MARSSAIVANTNATAAAMNLLRSDALGASRFLANQQSSPGMTVQVQPGVVYFGGTQLKYAGGNSGTYTAPSANPRIDLLCINSSGTLSSVTGSENASPVAPAYPGDKMVIAEITHRVGETTILDNENQTAGQGFLTDVRPFFTVPSVSSSIDQTSNYALNSSYTNTTNRVQLHTITLSLTSVSGQNPFVGWSANNGMQGQSYFSNGPANSSQIKAIVTFIVNPGNGFSTFTGGSGGSISVQYWYTSEL